MGLSHNPIFWVVPTIRLLAFLSLLVIAFLLLQEPAWASIVILLLVVPFFARFFKDMFIVDRTSALFFEDRLELDLRTPSGSRNGLRTYSFRDIRSIELRSMSEIRMTLVEKGADPFQIL